VEVELDPEQPEEVVRAVSELLGDRHATADPWWQAGVDDAVDTES
jgi:hypothetical protein